MRTALNGTIVADEDAEVYQWFGYQVTAPGMVRQALEAVPEGEELVLEVNSVGGDVFAGAEIYSLLRGAKVRTRAEVQSLAASAASMAMLGCGEVWISPAAQVMIHMPSTRTAGDQAEHRASIRVLDSLTESALNCYEAKCAGRRTRDQLRSMMARTTWMTAQEALDAGLVDGILWDGEPEPALKAVMAAAGGSIRAVMASAGPLPDIRDLRARYEAQRAAPAPKAEPEGWTARARLALERERM